MDSLQPTRALVRAFEVLMYHGDACEVEQGHYTSEISEGYLDLFEKYEHEQNPSIHRNDYAGGLPLAPTNTTSTAA